MCNLVSHYLNSLPRSQFNVARPCRLLANITRCFFWLGARFEYPLLVQSVLMILAQVRHVYIVPADDNDLCTIMTACVALHLYSLSSSCQSRGLWTVGTTI